MTTREIVDRLSLFGIPKDQGAGEPEHPDRDYQCQANFTDHLLLPFGDVVARAQASLAPLRRTSPGRGPGWWRHGLRGLVVLPPLAVVVPVLSFSSTTALFVAGAVVWGAGMGVHDSTMRAAVADFVPAHRRGAGYGTFTAIYGLAWLAGAALIGLLYEHSVTSVVTFIALVQAVSLLLLVPLLRRQHPGRLRA